MSNKRCLLHLTFGLLSGWTLLRSIYFLTFHRRLSIRVTVPMVPMVPVHQRSATTITVNDRSQCACDIAQTLDCLHMIQCMTITTSARQQEGIARGIWTRQLLRQLSRFEGFDHVHMGNSPLGKGLQYATIDVWERWTLNQSLPVQFNSHSDSIFVNESVYPYCVQNNLNGKNCFFRPLTDDDVLDTVEAEAVAQQQQQQKTDSAKQWLKQQLRHYLRYSRSFGTTQIQPLQHLLIFAHWCRIRFNRQPPIVESFEKHLVTMKNEQQQQQHPLLKVSLHVRRADSCDHQHEGFETIASNISQFAQVSSKRVCYHTAVYVQALQRIGYRNLEIYVSTDYAGSLLADIRAHFPTFYAQHTWKYLNFNRSTFDYKGMSIEDVSVDRATQAVLGETAVDDLWLLSHGQVFVGHLGSRFGKVGWYLATARYNTFIPYFSVDGRSVCCEIDEVCSTAARYIKSMEHCLTFVHDLAPVPPNKHDYWDIGSTQRIRYAQRVEQEYAKMKTNLTAKTKRRRDASIQRMASWLGLT